MRRYAGGTTIQSDTGDSPVDHEEGEDHAAEHDSRCPDRAERGSDAGGRDGDTGYRDRRSRGWAILYRVPEDGVHELDDARSYSVVSATGQRAHFMAWRKVGRRRLGVGIGRSPVGRD
jgi:hypothetical protein